jgi:hypothetical protein
VGRTTEAITKEVEEIIRIIAETIIGAIISVASIIITEVVVSIKGVATEEVTTDIRTRKDGSNSSSSLHSKTIQLTL